MNTKKDKNHVVFLVCTGLGNINRGYESFTRECFDNLKATTAFDLYLIKGGGYRNKKEIVVANFKRRGFMAGMLGRLFKRNTYYIEQASFLIGLLPLIILKKPSLIYYSDFVLGTLLWHVRKLFKFEYKLLFSNGAPNGPPFKTEDHIQQLLPFYHSIGVKCDGAGKHTCLPYAFNINLAERKNVIANKDVTRQHLGFSPNQKIVLSVGAVNSSHKRMNYIINEMALLSEDYYLIILGQFDDETESIMQLAENKIKNRYLIKNVPQNEVEKYYAAADYYVLASLLEGFGRATIEALSFGLPCIVHDYIVTRQLLQQYGLYADMRFDGMLAECLKSIEVDLWDKEKAMQFAYDTYSWQRLKYEYKKMIVHLLQ